ncbi:MAG: hypothetical protein HUJ95_02030, partial [Bacteroidales bacterium]|nr:hypothetical protein [Bacteroidales bacterium]
MEIHILIESFKSAFLVSGLVIIMMMLIESINIGGSSRFIKYFSKSRGAQVILGSFLGTIPGCMGGFASVSLYTHGMISFGALVAMMISSSGDEAFVMLAMIPDKAPWIFLGLFALAVAVGFVTDFFVKRPHHCEEWEKASADSISFKGKRSLTWQRTLMIVGLVAFNICLVLGFLEHEESHAIEGSAGINFLSEEWMYYMFAGLGLVLLALLCIGSDEYVAHHYWHHIVVHHLPKVFMWTFGTVLLIG